MIMKALVTGTALSLIFATAPMALAQQSGMPGSSPSPLAVNPTSGGQPPWYTQHGKEMRASKLIGATIVNDA